jgi:hypothetical protein
VHTQIDIDHFLQIPDGTVIARGGYVQAVHAKRRITYRGHVTDILAKPGVFWIIDEHSGTPKMLDVTDYEITRVRTSPNPSIGHSESRASRRASRSRRAETTCRTKVPSEVDDAIEGPAPGGKHGTPRKSTMCAVSRSVLPGRSLIDLC